MRVYWKGINDEMRLWKEQAQKQRELGRQWEKLSALIIYEGKVEFPEDGILELSKIVKG